MRSKESVPLASVLALMFLMVDSLPDQWHHMRLGGRYGGGYQWPPHAYRGQVRRGDISGPLMRIGGRYGGGNQWPPQASRGKVRRGEISGPSGVSGEGTEGGISGPLRRLGGRYGGGISGPHRLIGGRNGGGNQWPPLCKRGLGVSPKNI